MAETLDRPTQYFNILHGSVHHFDFPKMRTLLTLRPGALILGALYEFAQ